MPFQHYFSYIEVASAPIHAFLGFFFKPELRKIFFPYHWLLTHKTTLLTIDSNDRRMNPVTMTIHQSSERILAKPEVQRRTSDSQGLYTTN